MLVPVRVESLGVDRGTNSPVVVLRERDGNRQLPIWIGPAEASAIAVQIAGMSFGRPLTHDLFIAMLDATGATLKRIVIPRVKNNTYFAEMEIDRGGEVVRLDARPSDSIAIALRAEAEILAEEELLDRVILEIEEGEDATSAPGPSAADVDTTLEKGVSPNDLESYLRSLNPEDFGRFKP